MKVPSPCVKGEQGDEQFELAETAYSVVSLNTLSPEIFSEQPIAEAQPSNSAIAPVKKETATILSPLPIAPVFPSASADLEVEVLRLLSQAGADMGEQVSATREPDGLLHIAGIVESAERKVEIMRALETVVSNAAVRIEIQTVAE